MNSRLLPLAVVALAGFVHGCGDSDPTPATNAVADCPAQIEVVDNEFKPKTCKAKVGQKVIWVFKGMMEHDVVSGTKSGTRCSMLSYTVTRNLTSWNASDAIARTKVPRPST